VGALSLNKGLCRHRYRMVINQLQFIQ